MKTQDIMIIFQVRIINTHLNAIEVSSPVIEYNFSPSRETLLFGDEQRNSPAQ